MKTKIYRLSGFLFAAVAFLAVMLASGEPDPGLPRAWAMCAPLVFLLAAALSALASIALYRKGGAS